MAILQLPTPLAAQEGLRPATKKMVCTDSLATITTAGYLNSVSLESFPIATTDVLEVLYAYNTTTKVGSFGLFTVSITNGVITLAAQVIPGTATINGALVSGNIPDFNGTTGALSDSGISAANVMKLNAINTMAAGSEIILDKAAGTATAGAVTINKQAGVITTVALTTAGGANTVITLTNSLLTANSVFQVAWQGGTNTVANFSMSAVPGAGTGTITIYNNTAATALNGTIVIGFTVE